MKTAAVILLVFSALAASAQTASVTSRSGQFSVLDTRKIRSQSTNDALARLEPALVAVSCERIKSTLLSALNTPDRWRGKIFVALHTFQDADENIVIAANRFGDAWNYRVETPDAIEPERFVRAITQVLLIEMAGREAREQSPAIPAWLGEGMPQVVLAASDMDLVINGSDGGALPGDTLSVRRETHVNKLSDPFQRACEKLRGHAPLTLDQLASAPASLTDDDGEIFRASAFLFIHDLLQLSNGGANLAAALPELPWDSDWRVALLHSFHGSFKREVDLEKWWALQSVYAARRSATQSWSPHEVLKRLDATLRCAVEVQTAANEPPLRTDIPLQAAMKSWELPRQRELLRQKILQLTAVKMRAGRELSGLIEQYRRTLENYLRRIGGGERRAAALTGGRQPAVAMVSAGIPAENDAVVKDALAELAVLDERRAAWEDTVKKTP